MMVVADGGMDIPALPWCSVLEAVLWIEFRQIPIAWDLEGAIPGRIGTFGFAESGRSLADPRTYSTSFNRLFIEAREGSIPIRGNPGISFERSDNGNMAGKIVHTACGEPEIIPPSRLRDCGFIAFWSMPDTGFLAGGAVYPSELGPPNWIYSLVQVDFGRLSNRFPPRDGQTVRIGGEIILTGPTLPHVEWAGQAEPPNGGNLEVGDNASASVAAQVAPAGRFVDRSDLPDASRKPAAPSALSTKDAGGLKRGGKKAGLQQEADSDGALPLPATGDRDHGRQKRHLRTLEAAEYLSLSKSTLEKYRLSGDGPVYHKVGRICLYGIENLDAWMNARKRRSTSEPKL